MSYIGRGTDAISNVEKLDNITFNGGTTYALTKSSAAFTPVGANNILVSIDGVIQQGNFSVSTTNIVFDWSPTSSNTNNFILHYGTGVLNVPADDSVSAAKIASNAVTTAKINADAVTGAKIADDAIDSEHYVDGSIDNAHIADDQIDSEHYADGSIDTAHLGNLQVTTAKIAADAIDGTKLADDAVNSEHYTDGSIDLAHMSSESVDEDNLHISNAGSNGEYLQKQSGNAGGLTWAAAGGGASQSSIWYIPTHYAPSANDTIIVGWVESNAGGYNRLGTAPTESSDVFTMPATGWYWVSLNVTTIQLYTPTNDGVSPAIHLSTDTGSSFDPVVVGTLRHHAGGSPTEETINCTTAGLVKITNTTTDLIRLWVGGIDYSNTRIHGGSQDSTGNVGSTVVSFTKLADI